jgi:hypothetical protein
MGKFTLSTFEVWTPGRSSWLAALGDILTNRRAVVIIWELQNPEGCKERRATKINDRGNDSMRMPYEG